MPPRKQISKCQIIEKAFEMVRTEGYASLTARKLAKELNCSTQPIYQTFTDMKELKLELIKKAQEKMVHYIMDRSDTSIPIELASILAYIQFAGEEKHLFQLIFTSGEVNINAINELGMTGVKWNLNMIIYANGIIMMLAFNSFELSDENIKNMLIHAYELFESKR